MIPFSSGPSATYTVYDGYLAAGSYAIDSFLAVNNVVDPNYQINFAVSQAAAVPEPAAVTMLSVGLIGLGFVAPRRRRNGSGASVA